MAISPITTIPVDQDPNSNEYQIILPTRANEDGTPIRVAYDKSVKLEDAIADINEAMPRNSADTQIDKMQSGANYVLNKMSKEDYLQWTKDKDLWDESHDINLFDAAVHAAKDFGKGLVDTGIELFKTVGDFDQRKSARHLYNVAEGALLGTERLGMLGQMLYYGAAKAVLPSSLDYQQDADYNGYKKIYEMADVAQKRSEGQLLTEGASSPIFGTAIPKREDSVPAPQAEDIRAANSISNALDASWLLSGAGLLGKMGANTALKSVASKLVPSAIINEALPRLAMKGASLTGTALDKGSRFIIDQLANVVSAVSENSVSNSARQVSNMATRVMLYGGDMAYGTGGKLMMASLGGKALKAAGSVGEAALNGLEAGSVRQALAGLSEDTTKAATIRAAARAAARIAPPDSVTNALKGLADAAVNTGAFMGGIGAMQAYALNDDPIHGFMEGAASGVGVGLMMGVPHELAGIIKSKENRVAALFKQDLSSRPLKQRVEMTDADGNVITADIADAAGRMNLYNSPHLSTDAKELVLDMALKSEAAGNNFIFHDGTKETTDALNQMGLMGGKAVHVKRTDNGKSLIIVDPTAEGFKSADVVQEIFHSMASDGTGKDTFSAIKQNVKSDNPADAVNYLGEFGEKYTEILSQGDSEIGKAKAEDFRARIKDASRPELSDEQRVDILLPILDEYLANYAGAKLAGAKVKDVFPPKLSNYWDKAWDMVSSNVLSALDFSKQDIHLDPVYGHFFDSKGNLGVNPLLDGVVKDVLAAVSEGKTMVDAKNSFDGVRYFDIKTDSPIMFIEDMVDGRPTKNKREKDKIKSEWFKQAHDIASADPEVQVMAFTEELSKNGTFHGNVSGLQEGEPIIYSQNMSKETLLKLARIEVNGRRVIPASQEAHWLAALEAIKNRKIITIDAWHDIGRTQGSREGAYYGRGNRHIFPVAIQQTKSGGLNLAFVDISRAWNHATKIADKMPEVAAELRSKGITSMSDFVPVLKQYFENYSSPDRVPAHLLPGFSEGLRDVIYNSMNIRPRSERSKYFDMDRANVANQPTFEVDLFGPRKETVKMNGVDVEMQRNSVTLGQIRMDRIVGVSDFTLNGQPVSMAYDPRTVPNAIRANFAAKSTTREKIGTTEFVADEISGKRMVIEKDGKTTLFDGKSKTVFPTSDEAEVAANKASIKLAQDQILNFQYAAKARKNAYAPRSNPAAGKEAEHAAVVKELIPLVNYYEGYTKTPPEGYQSYSGKDKNKLGPIIKDMKERMNALSSTYHTEGNAGGTGSFYEHPLISEIKSMGGILTPRSAQKVYDKEGFGLRYQGYFDSSNHSIKDYVPAFHRGIFQDNGKIPTDIIETVFGLYPEYFNHNEPSVGEFFDVIQDISKNSKSFDMNSVGHEEHVYNAASELMKEGTGAVTTSTLEVGQEIKAGKYIAKVLSNENGAINFGIFNGKATTEGEAGTIKIGETGDLDWESMPTTMVNPSKKTAAKPKKQVAKGKEIDASRFESAASSSMTSLEALLNDMGGGSVAANNVNKDISVAIDIAKTNLQSSTKALQQLQSEIPVVASIPVEQKQNTSTIKLEVEKTKREQSKKIQETTKQVVENQQALDDVLQLQGLIHGTIVKEPKQVAVDRNLQIVDQFLNTGTNTTREQVSFIQRLVLDKLITAEQGQKARELNALRPVGVSWEAGREQSLNYVKNLLNGIDEVPVAPIKLPEPAIKVEPSEAAEFLKTDSEKKATAKEQRASAAKANKEAKAKAKEEKAAAKAQKQKSLRDMTAQEIAALSKDDFELKLKKLKPQEAKNAEFERRKWIVSDIAAKEVARGSTDPMFRPEYIESITSNDQLFKVGQKFGANSIERFNDYLESAIVKLKEEENSLIFKSLTSKPEQKKRIPLDEFDPQREDYATYLIRKKEMKETWARAVNDANKEMDIKERLPTKEGKMPTSKSAFSEGEVAIEQSLIAEPKSQQEIDLSRFEERASQDQLQATGRSVDAVIEGLIPKSNTDKLVANNPVAVRNEITKQVERKAAPKVVKRKDISAEDYVAQKEAKAYIKEEDKAKFLKEVESVYARNRGERSQREFDMKRNEQHAINMEELLKEKHTQNVQGEISGKDASFSKEPPAKPAPKESIKIVGNEIPENTEMVYTKQKKFMMYYLPTSSLIGIAGNYDQALKLTKKYADSKERGRASVRR